MELKTLINSESVMDDVNDLDAAFGYFRPIMEDDDESEDVEASAPTERPRRGRPRKDPVDAMSAADKAARRQMLVEAYNRVKKPAP